jgi:hypothetical protein
MTLCPGVRATGPWCCSSWSAPSGAPGVEQLEVTESEAWSSWRCSFTPARLGGTEWRTRQSSALASEWSGPGAVARGQPIAACSAWSSWRCSITPVRLGGTEWWTRRLSALLLAVPHGGAPDVGEWVDAGAGGCRSGGGVVLVSGRCRPKNRVAKKRRKRFDFQGHFAVAEDVISVGRLRKPIAASCVGRASGGFLSSKAGFGSLVFVWASGFLGSEAVRKPKQTPP